MPERTWSHRSKRVYDTLDPRLQKLVIRMRDEVGDISLTSGHRDCQEQMELFHAGASTLTWPNSKHNKRPSIAVDFAPYPYPADENKLWGALGYLAGHAMRIAKEEGFEVRWGGDWNGDGDLTNQSFDDLFHLEVKE